MKNSKKILIVTSEFPPQPGGIGNHAFNLATHLKLNGFDVDVMTDERSKDGLIEKKFDDLLPFKVFRIKRFKLLIRTYLKRILLYSQISNSYSNIIASGKFSLWLVGFGILNAKSKRIAVIHGSEVNFKKKGPKKMTDAALKRFDQVIAVSNFTKSLVSHLELKDIHIIPNGVEIDGFEKLTIKSDLKGHPKLLTVGAISDRKGQHNVIEKLPDLIKIYPAIHYHMVGIPSEKEKLLKLAKQLKVETHITFHGVLSQLKLVEMLSGSDIFVMLSELTVEGDVEGFGIAILEANYMGLPTIGSKGCGIEDAIDNYKSGILVNYNNLAEFKLALHEILKHKEFYKKRSKEWAFKHTWETMIKKYIKLIAK